MSAGPLLAGLFVREPKISRVQRDFEYLLDRVGRRLYPETLESLAYYWLKTVFANGYERDEWNALDRLLGQAETVAAGPEMKVFEDLRTRIRRAGLGKREAARAEAKPVDERRTGPVGLALVPYTIRVLNEWAPVEVARLLVRDADGTGREERGIPAVAFGKALERLFVRERLGNATLEALLQPRLFDPRYVYPADVEVLRDVVLFLLGRADAPVVDVLPATLLCVAPQSKLPADYADEVRRATLCEESGQLEVPISSSEALEALMAEKVRITSVVVTMDGRWWQADQLKGGSGSAVLYKPMGRLSMDYSSDHVRVRVPWPEARLHWSGSVQFAAPIEIFGRAWHIAHWEQDAERTWLDLEFAGVLPIAEIAAEAEPVLRRSRPAYVDMAWTALENALVEGLAAGSLDPVEQQRRENLIPLGRALHAFCEAVMDRKLRKLETLEPRLRAIAYHAAEVEPEFGKIPWRVLPEAVQKNLLRQRLFADLSESLTRVFEHLPQQESGKASAKAADAVQAAT